MNRGTMIKEQAAHLGTFSDRRGAQGIKGRMTLCLECKEPVMRRHVGRRDLAKRTTCRGGRTTSTCESSRVSISAVEVPRAACNIPKGNGSALSERVTGRHGVRHSVRHSVRPAREGEPREIMRLGARLYALFKFLEQRAIFAIYFKLRADIVGRAHTAPR